MTSSFSSPPAALRVLALVVFAAACAPSHTTRRQSFVEPMVTAADIEHSGGEPILEVLQAKVPGLSVTRGANGTVAVEVRGTSSFYGSNEPLYVIDEVPFQAGPGGALTGINPHDIESIRLLKNPADIAIYGMRGSNGVILVKTKRPGKLH
jgi:TonB-dependent SusC/RagA subfamily outer membrane receptor